MLTDCFRFAPRDSVPGLIAKICKYLKDHPGWSEEELEEQIKKFMGQTGVESFNGRTGAVALNEDDVNNLKIASAYFAVGDETIANLNLKELYNKGVRFVFTNFNGATYGYDLAFVLKYLSDTDSVFYYPMASGAGGGSVISVNGKTGIVELKLSDILDGSGAQVKLCTETEFTSTELNKWNSYYEEGYRIVGVVNSGATAIDSIYLLRQDENNHQPIVISVGASNAYTPDNPPPYPVLAVNGETGNIKLSKLVSHTGYISFLSHDNFNGFNVFNNNTYMGSIRMYNNIEDNGFYRLRQINKEDNDSADIYTTAYPPPYPVQSVNYKTGAVFVSELIASDDSLTLIQQDGYSGFYLNNKEGFVDSLRFNERIVNNGYHRIEQVNTTNTDTTTVYTAADPPKFKNEINATTAWLIGPGWGSYFAGLLLYTTTVTPDESGWITIPWPTSVVNVYSVISYFVFSAYPATLHSVTINTGTNIRAALSYGSSPWPNQKPFQLNLLLIAS